MSSLSTLLYGLQDALSSREVPRIDRLYIAVYRYGETLSTLSLERGLTCLEREEQERVRCALNTAVDAMLTMGMRV